MLTKFKNKKAIIPTMLMLGIIVTGLLSVSYASAHESGEYPTIVKKLADKFNLNEDEVKAVFDEDRQEHFADMQANWAERLDDLVSEGKITNSQKDAIIKKHEEMHNKMVELKDLSPEERKVKMTEIREELKTWAESEGIDMSFIGPMKFKFKGPGHGDRVFFHEKLD